MSKKIITLLISIIIVVLVGGGIYILNHQNNDIQISNNERNNMSVVNVEQSDDGLILIKGGSFEMGSPETELQREEDELQHTVTISDFYISPYEVTQAQYEEIMGENPSNFIGENLPVDSVSWYEAIEFCNKLSENKGLTPVYTIDNQNVTWNRNANGYRLLTEAEWEYAARAGTTTRKFNS